jgi:hypothetical protein
MDVRAGAPGGRGDGGMPGTTYGSLSNLIVSFTAVVWDAARDSYVLRTFDRADADAAVYLAHLGRAFLTEVTLRVAADRTLRCLSRVDIPAAELFAPAGAGGRVPGATTPTLSAIQPRDDRPEWNVAVWLDVLTLPGTAHADDFYRELEAFVFATYDGSWAGARVRMVEGLGVRGPGRLVCPDDARRDGPRVVPVRSGHGVAQRGRRPRRVRPAPDLHQPVPGPAAELSVPG